MNAIEYHLQTRHFPNKFAKSLGYLDRENQPNPYKSYFKAPKFPLKISKSFDYPYEKLYLKNDFKDFNLTNVSKFFELSLALSAIKEYLSSRWAVRINPSSGNLHPEESYIIWQKGVYHFNVKEFCLEEIAKSEEILVDEGFIFVLTSIPLRESWKYGERALRYSLLDSGHAIASCRFASNLLGWKMEIIDEFSDKELEKLIGLDKQKFFKNEEEVFETAFYVYNKKKPTLNLKMFERLNFELNYIPLTKESVRWDIIFETDLKRDEKIKNKVLKEKTTFLASLFNAEEIIKNRRSALGYKKSFIKKDEFFDILDKTIARDIPPFDTNSFLNEIDFVVFVNRVDGTESGIYFFDRKSNRLDLIQKGDFSNESKFINCMQDIAKNSSFTISMVIDKHKIKKNYQYKLAMFEAGMIGQILYLEAEAKNLRGCGIGCFFDDLISIDILNNRDILTLYGFSIGEPIVDERIIPIKANEGKLL